MNSDIPNYFRIKPKEIMKDLDVTSNKQELANNDKDANLRWDNDPDETKRAVGSQNPAMMQKEICWWSWIVGLANQSHFYGSGLMGYPVSKKPPQNCRITPVFPRRAKQDIQQAWRLWHACAGWKVKQPKMSMVEECRLMIISIFWSIM